MMQNRRKKILVKKKFQLLYVGYILAFIFLASCVSALTVFHTIFSTLGEKLAGIYPEGRLMAIFGKTMLILARNLLILTPVIAIIGIFLSHRIAGPVFRIEKIMGDIGRGDFKIRLSLRKNDQLKEMADALNRMAALLDAKDNAEKEAARIIARDLSALRTHVEKCTIDTPGLVKRLSEMEEAIKKLSKA